MSMVVCRIEKSKSASVGGMAAHWYRERETPNADPSRTHLNRTLIGSGDVRADVAAALKRVTKPPRKDAVRNVEMILSASPEYFRDPGQGPGEYNPDRLEAWVAAKTRFLVEQYGERVVAAHLQVDEETPHIHVAIVPLAENPDGSIGLAAKRLFDKPQLRKLQTAAAEAVAHLGIERGTIDSKDVHRDLKDFRRDQAKRLAEIERREADLDRREEWVLKAEAAIAKRETRLAEASAVARAAQAKADAMIVGLARVTDGSIVDGDPSTGELTLDAAYEAGAYVKERERLAPALAWIAAEARRFRQRVDAAVERRITALGSAFKKAESWISNLEISAAEKWRKRNELKQHRADLAPHSQLSTDEPKASARPRPR